MPKLATVGLVVFWSSVAIVGFTYIGYPLLLLVVARVCGRAPVPPCGSSRLPRVSLLIVAHNEEAIIGHRIENALRLDYPPDRLDVVVASDGSTDGTAAIVQAFASRGVRLRTFVDRRGKAAVLNELIPVLPGSIVVLSDANTFMERDAVRKFARWFDDPTVGVVCGRLRLIDRRSGTNVDGLYWSIETALKEQEARLGAILGANGANYALRREAFPHVPDTVIIEDLVIPLRSRLERGWRIVFDGEAVAAEETAPEMQIEFERRARIGAGGFQAIALLWRLLHPKHGWVAVTFFCHKVLRWVCPFFMLAALGGNALLAAEGVYLVALGGQLTFHAAALGWLTVRPRVSLPRAVLLAIMFHTMNLALLVGFWRWAASSQPAAWSRTPRS